MGNVRAYAVIGNFTVQHPFECFFVFKRLSQHIVHFQHINATLTHFILEIQMVLLGFFNPQHIIKQ